ncbi:hypothetical protein JWJ90_17190 [Desulfobulbus rhabdoformis]|jgi:hypothetical protein|uniref:hypothetical protein n=1 Tax=Desulfobulbus rhabdoformis TaxID=34032 RepID=UPI0019666C77|nr:hypothetical protein [Desulfobulbus rhabdoformis]MBM9616007.1 hypothetical protein [Desulfobulbus rhabdoformis]
MKKFYVVHNGEAKVVDTKTLNSYPFVSEAAKESSDRFSEDWHAHNATSTQWCVAYAENDREAVELTDKSSRGLVAKENVWCEVSRVPYEERVK